MLAKNCAEQGVGRRKADALQGQQRSYAEFYATDDKGFYLIIVLLFRSIYHFLSVAQCRLSDVNSADNSREFVYSAFVVEK